MGPDQRILDVVVDHRSTGLDTAMRVVTEFGSFWVLWLIGIAVTIVWWRRFGDWLAARVLAITAGTAWASSNLIKWIVDRDRPPLGLRLVDATGSAFPSGHSTQSAAMYGAIAVLWAVHQPDPRRGRVALVLAGLVAVAVGLSRVYLGVHWSFDAFGVNGRGEFDPSLDVGGVQLGLKIAEDIFAFGNGKGPSKSPV